MPHQSQPCIGWQDDIGDPVGEGGCEDEAEENSKDGRLHDPNSYFTVAPVDSMVTVPPVGTAIGAMSKPSTMGLSVVRPSGIKLCPPNIPMSLREPSWSLYWGSGGPRVDRRAESGARVKSLCHQFWGRNIENNVVTNYPAFK